MLKKSRVYRGNTVILTTAFYVFVLDKAKIIKINQKYIDTDKFEMYNINIK